MQLHNEIGEIKVLLATLTLQVIAQLEEANARRASTSRAIARVDMVTGVNRTQQTALRCRNIQNDFDEEFECPLRTPYGTLDPDQLPTAILDLQRQKKSTPIRAKLI